MKHRIRAICLLPWLLLPAFMASGAKGQAQEPRNGEAARDLKPFIDRVQAYVELQNNLDASLSALKPTKDAAEIAEHQHELARRIAAVRRDARQGDIFTHEAAERFRKIIRKAFSGPEGRAARRTIRQDNPSKAIVRLHVNDVFPEDVELTTTPRNLLLLLPELPRELEYRFVGRDLTLVDIKARLIVDLIPKAIP